jgi:hypothetical protein
MGSNYLKDKVSGMGYKRFAKGNRVVARKAPPAKRSFGGSDVGCGVFQQDAEVLYIWYGNRLDSRSYGSTCASTSKNS